MMVPLQRDASARQRSRRLYDELGFALSRLERDALAGWGRRSGGRLLLLTGRRVGGLAKLASLLARAGGGELLGLLEAYRQRRLSGHVGDRSAAAIDGTLAIGREGKRMVAGVARALARDPKANAPAVLGALLGFGAGSGGLDGNGGLPDLDLLAGIGAHRSPLTHTLVAGIVVEGLLLALADLAAEVHGRLPVDHDPLWDALAKIGRPLTINLAIGTSAGLAYHLLVDALVQPGAYHGLPIKMPMEAHQAGLAINGLAEGADAAARAKRHRPVEIVQGGVPEKSAGRKTVDAVAGLASRLTARFGRAS
ncbi:MAG: hypothetical protein Q8O25_02365 [Sulfurisoma sp.]|nr:hypothetical protein [Sulfurisoma sp.]